MKASFDLRQLRYFVAVAETLSFRRAAERLFISQPPLSRQITALEKSLGVRLFERSTTSVKLTADGEDALKRARKLLADAESFGKAFERSSRRGKEALRVAVSVAIPVADRRRLAGAWKRELGPLHVEFAESRLLLPRLRSGQVDYALVGAAEESADLAQELVHAIPLVAVMPRSHPAARKPSVRLSDLASTPFFWLPRNYNPPYYAQCAKVFARRRFAPRFITVQPGQLQTLERIAEGEGCTLMSRAQLSRPVKGVVQRPLEEGASLGVRIAAVWRRDDGERDRTGLALAKVARKVLAG